MEFPQYRVLEGAETLYVIEGPRHAVEFQPLGFKQWMSHAHVATGLSEVCLAARIEG